MAQGKSTLLGLIRGEIILKGYSNDLTLFGRKRGGGKTILGGSNAILVMLVMPYIKAIASLQV